MCDKPQDPCTWLVEAARPGMRSAFAAKARPGGVQGMTPGRATARLDFVHACRCLVHAACLHRRHAGEHMLTRIRQRLSGTAARGNPAAPAHSADGHVCACVCVGGGVRLTSRPSLTSAIDFSRWSPADCAMAGGGARGRPVAVRVELPLLANGLVAALALLALLALLGLLGLPDVAAGSSACVHASAARGVQRTEQGASSAGCLNTGASGRHASRGAGLVPATLPWHDGTRPPHDGVWHDGTRPPQQVAKHNAGC